MARRPPRAVNTQRSRRTKPAVDFDDVIYGIHAVDEALAAGEALRTIHLADDRKKDMPLRSLLARAREHDIPVRFEKREFFTQFPLRVHQGVVAIAPPFEYAALHDVIEGRGLLAHRLVVVLDHLTDPHNVGAIVRTAECIGADGVVLPDRRSAGVNATVRKAAAGGAGHIPIARVGNIVNAIGVMKKAGIWIAGADAGPQAVDVRRADFDRDLALVIGAEGSGLSQLVRRECDYLVRIPMLGQVASLNASVAGAILLYEALRQQESLNRP